MDKEQQIRAAGMQAAATFMSGSNADPFNLLFVANFSSVFIEHGWDAAIAQVKGEPVPAAPAGPQAAALVEQTTKPVEAVQPSGGPVSYDKPVAETSLPAEAASSLPKAQEQAFSRIEGIKKDRVRQIMKEAAMAKAAAHKSRIFDDAEAAGLLQYTVVHNGKNMTLETYLGSV